MTPFTAVVVFLALALLALLIAQQVWRWQHPGYGMEQPRSYVPDDDPRDPE